MPWRGLSGSPSRTNMKALSLAGRAATLVSCLVSWSAAQAQSQAPASAKAIPFAQLGAEAQKQYSGDGIGITPTQYGAILKAAFQRLEGRATAEGLWLTSTAEEDQGKDTRFQVRAASLGRVATSARVAAFARTWMESFFA